MWTWWYENGQKRNEGSYIDSKRDGKWTWWYENGQKEHEGYYKEHMRVGQSSHWNENGDIQKEEVEIEYYPDGSVQWIYEPLSRYTAQFTSYYSNGGIESLGKYSREDLYPENFEYDFDGWVDEMREYDEYTLAASRPREKIGLWNYWYENGRIKEQCAYLGDAIDGLYIGYYKNGQKKIEKTYKAVEDEPWEPYTVPIRMLSLKDGITIVYRRNGTKKIELNYKDDMKHGKSTVWDKNGQIVSEANYKENSSALKYADDTLKADRELVLEAVKNRASALEYANDAFKADREGVLEAVKNAVKNYGYALKYADDSLTNDREFMLEAIKIWRAALPDDDDIPF